MMYSMDAVLGACWTWCILYLLYAILSVNCWSCHGEIDKDDVTLCSAMMIERWTKERDQGWRWGSYGGYEQIWTIRGTTGLIGVRTPCISVITTGIGTCACCIGDGESTCTQNSLMSSFFKMIFRITSHLSLSCPQLDHHLRTQS